MTRFNLEDLDFLDDTVEDLEIMQVQHFESLMDNTVKLEDNDPRRKVFKTVAMLAYMILNNINYVGKQTRLSDAEDMYLDFLGEEKNTTRNVAKPAKTIIEFICLGEEGFTIPKGTMAYVNEHYFESDSDFLVAEGETSVVIPFTAMEPGSQANGFLPGQIVDLFSIDEFPQVLEIQNLSWTDGGIDVEDDDSYAERIRLAGNKFATAGPSEAWIYHAKSADSGISDVFPDCPEANCINLYLLGADGTFTTDAQKQAVLDACNDRTIRPLGDLVSVLDPEIVAYDIAVNYYCDDSQDQQQIARDIKKVVDEYVLWQKAKIGRGIDSSRLLANLQAVGAQRLSISPNFYQAINNTALAVANDVEITFEGVIND